MNIEYAHIYRAKVKVHISKIHSYRRFSRMENPITNQWNFKYQIITQIISFSKLQISRKLKLAKQKEQTNKLVIEITLKGAAEISLKCSKKSHRSTNCFCSAQIQSKLQLKIILIARFDKLFCRLLCCHDFIYRPQSNSGCKSSREPSSNDRKHSSDEMCPNEFRLEFMLSESQEIAL